MVRWFVGFYSYLIVCNCFKEDPFNKAVTLILLSFICIQNTQLFWVKHFQRLKLPPLQLCHKKSLKVRIIMNP